jgi:hypothetical protein
MVVLENSKMKLNMRVDDKAGRENLKTTFEKMRTGTSFTQMIHVFTPIQRASMEITVFLSSMIWCASSSSVHFTQWLRFMDGLRRR